jgi:hypothetical protein
MTFIAGLDGTVYRKDLGPDTTIDAAAMDGVHPDPTWVPVPTDR